MEKIISFIFILFFRSVCIGQSFDEDAVIINFPLRISLDGHIGVSENLNLDKYDGFMNVRFPTAKDYSSNIGVWFSGIENEGTDRNFNTTYWYQMTGHITAGIRKGNYSVGKPYNGYDDSLDIKNYGGIPVSMNYSGWGFNTEYVYESKKNRNYMKVGVEWNFLTHHVVTENNLAHASDIYLKTRKIKIELGLGWGIKSNLAIEWKLGFFDVSNRKDDYSIVKNNVTELHQYLDEDIGFKGATSLGLVFFLNLSKPATYYFDK